MKTLGIDLSSMPGGTSACLITWENQRAVAAAPESGCNDDELDKLINGADVIGIDAPFGWPLEFVRAVADWPYKEWNNEIRDRLRLRETDRFVHEQTGLYPLSVSSDRIALPAMRAMALLKRHGVTDRSGNSKFFEVYPAGSLAAWELPNSGYKDPEKGRQARRGILTKLRKAMPWLDIPDAYRENADDLDSLIASLTARAAATGLTHLPNANALPAARQEGWIHITREWPFL